MQWNGNHFFQNIFQGYKNIFNVPNIECQIMLFVPRWYPYRVLKLALV